MSYMVLASILTLPFPFPSLALIELCYPLASAFSSKSFYFWIEDKRLIEESAIALLLFLQKRQQTVARTIMEPTTTQAMITSNMLFLPSVFDSEET